MSDPIQTETAYRLDTTARLIRDAAAYLTILTDSEGLDTAETAEAEAIIERLTSEANYLEQRALERAEAAEIQLPPTEPEADPYAPTEEVAA